MRTKRRGVPNLGERIASFMEAASLDASELAARTGISVSYLTRIIRGEVVNPTIDFISRIASGLGVTETELVREDILGRRMPPEIGEDDEGVKSKQQARSTPISFMARPALSLPDSPLDATFDQIEAYFKSKHFSKEQMETAAIELFESAQQIARLIKPEHE